MCGVAARRNRAAARRCGCRGAAGHVGVRRAKDAKDAFRALWTCRTFPDGSCVDLALCLGAVAECNWRKEQTLKYSDISDIN
eukprot:gene17372-biopygen5333